MSFYNLFEPNRGFRIFEIHEIYTGQTNLDGLYIPNVRDKIVDMDNAIEYIVTDVDGTTGLSTKRVWKVSPVSNSVLDLDVFLSSGPGTPSEGFRCLLDTSVIPFRLAISDRLYMYSSQSAYIKVFLGSDISENGTVISQYYNQSNVLIGDSIPLETATVPDVNNVSILTAKIGSSNRALNDGELVTVVVYSSLGTVTSTSQLVIKNTRFIRAGTAPVRYVVSITLDSPFVSPSDSHVLQYPINSTVDSASLMGTVHYNDGSTQRFPVDGNKFTLHGIENYLSTQAGQRVPLVLTYVLSNDESSQDSNIAQNGNISTTYYFESVAIDGAYSVKLFGYPRWLDDTRGYIMDYWLYNLDRNLSVPVNPWVSLASNSAPFDPTAYGTSQTFTVQINLQDIDPLLEAYNHVQVLNVVLNSRGSVQTVPNWTIGFAPGQSPRYGVSAVASLHELSVSVWNLNIDCGYGSKEAWIRGLYYDALPLYNPQSEVEAPYPTHVELVFKNDSREITVDQWSETLTVQNDLAQGELLRLRWIKRTSNGDLLLASTCLACHIV